MEVSEKGLELIANFEGFRSKAYDDGVGVITIGYGTTRYADGSKVKWGDTITQEKAWEYLEKQVNEHATTIEQYVKVPLTQNQFDALASFHYNLGKHILKGSKLLNYLNNQQWLKAVAEMQRYNKGGGKVMLGLVRRREAEGDLFLSGSGLVNDIKVDGSWGKETTKALQRHYKTTVDGVISHQPKNKNTQQIYSVEYGLPNVGSQLVKRMQKKNGTIVDGVISYPSNLIKALQKRLGMQQDGVITKTFIKKMQEALNKGNL